MLTAAQSKKWFLLLAFSILLFSASALRAQDTGNIVGEVRVSSGGFPPQRVLVTLQIRGAPLDSLFCDNEGRFAFYNLLPNLYYLVINTDEYQPVQQMVIVNPKIAQQTYVHIVITPREKTKAGKPPDAASGGNPYAVNASDSSKSYPPEVKKEYDAGVKADRQGKADDAIRHYQKAIGLAPDFYPAHNNLGVRYLDKGDLRAAESEFAQVTKLHQTDAQAYFNLGNVYYLTKRYDEAARTLQEGLRRDPASALGNFLLGAVQIRLGTLEDAERSLRAAMSLDPQMSKTRLELANLYLVAGKRTDAIRELKSFVEQFPHDPMLSKVKEVLKKLERPNIPPQ